MELRDYPFGRWRIFEPVNRNYTYVAAVDTASGKSGANESVCLFLCVNTGQQVAICAGLIPPEEMASECEKGGNYYKGPDGKPALLAVEKEFHGATIISKMRGSYGNLYYHKEAFVGFTMTPSEYGWNPQKYRQPAIDFLQEDIGRSVSADKEMQKRGIWIHDPDTINQLGYFVRNKKTGKWEASAGKYDDRVSALYIANFVRREIYDEVCPNKTEEKPQGKTYLEMISETEDEDEYIGLANA